MKTPFLTTLGLAAMASITLILPATATVVIDWVTVGDINNPADTRVMNDGTTGYGSVDHVYNIGKYEVTISQYAGFLNAVAKTDAYGLYNTSMGTINRIAGISRRGSPGSYVYGVMGSGDRPITCVSWFEAARFCNWLHNGQPVGPQTALTTENGVYSLLGALSGVGFTPQAGAMFWIPSEDEWYKAAYYDASKNGGAGGYWLHATQSNTLAGNTIGVAHSANFYDGDYVGSGSDSFPTGNALTDVGAYGANSASYYGTNDQGGNVQEWNDAAIMEYARGLRGGLWYQGANQLRSSFRGFTTSSIKGEGGNGFRLAAIPELSVSLLVLFGGWLGIARRRRPTL